MNNQIRIEDTIERLVERNVIVSNMDLGQKGSPSIHPIAINMILGRLGYVLSPNYLPKFKANTCDNIYNVPIVIIAKKLNLTEVDMPKLIETYNKYMACAHRLKMYDDNLCELKREAKLTGKMVEVEKPKDIEFVPETEMDNAFINVINAHYPTRFITVLGNEKEYNEFLKYSDLMGHLEVANSNDDFPGLINVMKSGIIKGFNVQGMSVVDKVILDKGLNLVPGSVFTFKHEEGNSVNVAINTPYTFNVITTLEDDTIGLIHGTPVNGVFNLSLDKSSERTYIKPIGRFNVFDIDFGTGKICFPLINDDCMIFIDVNKENIEVGFIDDPYSVLTLNRKIDAIIDEFQDSNMTLGNFAVGVGLGIYDEVKDKMRTNIYVGEMYSTIKELIKMGDE